MRDITRLPKWVQDEIASLQAQAKVAEDRAASAFGETPTAIEVGTSRRYGDQRPHIYIPENQTIEFTVDGGKIDARLRDGSLELYGNSIGRGYTMAVCPNVSNVISLHFVLRDRADQ